MQPVMTDPAVRRTASLSFGYWNFQDEEYPPWRAGRRPDRGPRGTARHPVEIFLSGAL